MKDNIKFYCLSNKQVFWNRPETMIVIVLFSVITIALAFFDNYWIGPVLLFMFVLFQVHRIFTATRTLSIEVDNNFISIQRNELITYNLKTVTIKNYALRGSIVGLYFMEGKVVTIVYAHDFSARDWRKIRSLISKSVRIKEIVNDYSGFIGRDTKKL